MIVFLPVDIEQLDRWMLHGSEVNDPYIVLSQHQMQNLGNGITFTSRILFIIRVVSIAEWLCS